MINKLIEWNVLDANSWYEGCGDVKLDMMNCITNGNIVIIRALLQRNPTLIHDKIKVSIYKVSILLLCNLQVLNFLSYVIV